MAIKIRKTPKDLFKFKQFSVRQAANTMKVGTDGILLAAISSHEKANRILDIGTGTGLIALMLAQKYPKAAIDGVEIDEEFAKEAQLNFENSPWADRLHIIQQSIQDFSLNQVKTYDLIVSNPPFFTGGTLSESQSRNSVRHTQKLSHIDLLASVRRLLSKEGSFYIILPIIEGRRMIEIATNYGFQLAKEITIFPKENLNSNRLILCLKSRIGTVNQLVKQDIVLYNEDEMRTEAYYNLVKDFYL